MPGGIAAAKTKRVKASQPERLFETPAAGIYEPSKETSKDIVIFPVSAYRRPNRISVFHSEPV